MVLNVAAIDTAYTNGQSYYRNWKKAPTQTTGAGIWFDVSMSPGQPVPNYYAAAPGIAIALARSTDGGLDHGPNVTPATKYLHKFQINTQTAAAVPLTAIICDYLMYYPFVDQSIIGEQDLTTNITLPRYPTGHGVSIMAVMVAAQAGGSSFYCLYTNDQGVSGRQTATVTCNSQGVNGTIVTSAPNTAGCLGHFIPLQAGDTGVQSIQSVWFQSGDVGLITLVLVKPLATTVIYDITAPVVTDFLIDFNRLPIIVDDAYLNFICCPNGTLSGASLQGEIQTFWST